MHSDLEIYEKALQERDSGLCAHITLISRQECRDAVDTLIALDSRDTSLCMSEACVVDVRQAAAFDLISDAVHAHDLSLCADKRISSLVWLCRAEVSGAIAEDNTDLCKFGFILNQSAAQTSTAGLYSEHCLARLAIETGNYTYCDFVKDRDSTGSVYMLCRTLVAEATGELAACDFDYSEASLMLEDYTKRCIKGALARQVNKLDTCYQKAEGWESPFMADYAKSCITRYFLENPNVPECRMRNPIVRNMCEWEIKRLG
jgi:hypothetical protein